MLKKNIYLIIFIIISLSVIGVISYLVLQEKPEKEIIQFPIPTKEKERGLEEVLKSLTPERKEPMSEEEKQALEKALESSTPSPGQTSEVPEDVLESLTPPE